MSGFQKGQYRLVAVPHWFNQTMPSKCYLIHSLFLQNWKSCRTWGYFEWAPAQPLGEYLFINFGIYQLFQFRCYMKWNCFYRKLHTSSSLFRLGMCCTLLFHPCKLLEEFNVTEVSPHFIPWTYKNFHEENLKFILVLIKLDLALSISPWWKELVESTNDLRIAF